MGESSVSGPPFGSAPVDRGPTTFQEDDFDFVQCFLVVVKQRNIDTLYELISTIELSRGLR